MFDRVARTTVATAVAAILTCVSATATAHDRDRRDHDDHGWFDRMGWHGHHGDGHSDKRDPEAITLTALATYDAGGLGSAEIVAYDAQSRRLFVVNALTSTDRHPRRAQCEAAPQGENDRHVRHRLAEQRFGA